ncbi:hypothetical protein ACN4EE_04555 [Geminocystis sp. CENA526]
MGLVYLSKNKVLGCFFSALIADNLINKSDYLLEQLPIFLNNINKFNNLTNFEENISFISLFPLIVYSYQNAETKEIIEQWQNQQPTLEILVIIVNLILSKKLNLNEPIKQIINHLNTQDSSLINSLDRLDRTLSNKETLTVIETIFKDNFALESVAIYQTLYLFFSNPYALENCLQRSLYFSQKIQETTILTGYLLGLYHGYSNLSSEWLNTIKLNPKTKEIKTLTEKLVAKWQGKMDNK